MNFSNEEIFSMYGQYDKFVSVDFRPQSESFEKYGSSLIGIFKYSKEERESLTQLLVEAKVPRTDKKILFFPSDLKKLTSNQIEELDKNGFLCSDIVSISSLMTENSNRYSTKGKKDIPNTFEIQIDSNSWQDLNGILYGFLNSRYSKNKNLSPQELNQYFGLRTYFNDKTTENDYISFVFEEDGLTIKKKIRFYELKAKFLDAKITDNEMLEYVIQVSDEIKEKDRIIETEIQNPNEKITELEKKYGDKIENLEKICLTFKEQVLLYGEKLVYLDFERFVHIFARHVSETQVSDKYTGKTVFQYKFDDILSLMSTVLEFASSEIQQHFKDNPEANFIRRGLRSIYYDGHYYRIDIDNTGRLLTFHPYNNNEEKDIDNEK